MTSGLRWVLLGLLGLFVAGAVAFLAIRTVSEKIGISAESPAAGVALAPAPKAPPRKKSAPDHGGTSTTTVQSPPAAPSGQTGDDYAAGNEREGGDD
jgi:hypothetical protein